MFGIRVCFALSKIFTLNKVFPLDNFSMLLISPKQNNAEFSRRFATWKALNPKHASVIRKSEKSEFRLVQTLSGRQVLLEKVVFLHRIHGFRFFGAKFKPIAGQLKDTGC